MHRNTTNHLKGPLDPHLQGRSPYDRSAYASFVISTLLVISAVLLTKALPFQESTTYVLLVFAVTLSAWYGGFWSGFLAIVFATILSNFLLIPPAFSFSGNDDLLRMLLFITLSIIVSAWANAQKSTRQALQKAEERFRLLMRNVVDYAILLLDHRGLILDWNVGADDILRLNDTARGRPLSTIFAPEDEAEEADADLISRASRNRLPSERWYVRADGTKFWGFSVLTALRNDRETLAGYVMILRDLTERKHRDEEREQLIQNLDRANKEREHFMAVLAHDLRGYASNVIGWSTLGRSGKFETAQSVLHAFEAIERASRQQVDLMEKMLELARMTSGNSQLTVCSFDVTTVVRNAVDTIRSAAELKHIEIIQSCSLNTTIDGDPDRLLQALLNLLWNALKYTPTNGLIQVGCAVQDSFLEISVSDNGPGIPADFLPEIFEPFRCGVRSGQAGTGLGLAIVRQIVNLHGGQVHAQNLDRQRGSKFTMILPVSRSSRVLNCA